jgi:hypothetical protein
MTRSIPVLVAILGGGLACAGLPETAPPAPAPVAAPAPPTPPEADRPGNGRKAPVEGAECGARAKPTCVEDSIAECVDGKWKLAPCDPYGCSRSGRPASRG